jgi:hypothetical protein
MVDVVIGDPTQVNLVLKVSILKGIATIIMAYATDEIYYDQHLHDMFSPLFVEVFGFLHQYANDFKSMG